ncbi:pyridoxal phosphate-dependent transferase [Microdochium trichocladiopsis]|uniref:Aspartate aminotransferase n=1 Tax=Microdochium trichocladiopsis TaxID=1682393 RepID=A0A9P8XZ23_9PEZI|nr:pyridoxal phosphate-dependent transferase [Microdochium trichocladiopsis]KAH7025160.1 pyridoxal phosphate-dependent transferase [Microdochium trichocladiopsis]
MADTPVVNLLQKLMEIPSISEEEEEIGLFIEEYLTGLGYTVELIPIEPGSSRRNVYAYLGNNRKARTMLTSHMDTVPPHIPFSIRDNIIYGRGACDDKGPMAAQIVALEELRAENAVKDGDVSLLFVVGEEKGGPGMLAVNNMGLSWETVIFGEPREGTLGTGHKGHFVFELFARGIPCHSGYPHLGRSANDRLVSVLHELASLPLPTSDLLGPTTYHCGKLEGGLAYNVVAAEAYALCGIRVSADLPNIEKQVADVVSKYPDIELKKSFAYPETMLDHEFEANAFCCLEGIEHKPVSGYLVPILWDRVPSRTLLTEVSQETMPNTLIEIAVLERDEAFAITADFIADQDPRKVSLGAGYLPIGGHELFLNVAKALVLGDEYDHSRSHVVSVQTISGTGANHLGALFLAQQVQPRNVFISDPTWSNHHLIWQMAAPAVARRTYPYYEPSSQSLDFEGMKNTLESEAKEGDVVILHACAHNPTGIDPTREQWRELAELFLRKKLFAFFDSAYQGFATGDVDADAWAIRHFHKTLFGGGGGGGSPSPSTGREGSPAGMCVTQSFAKNFGLYGERVGALHLVLPPEASPLGPQSQLHRLIRAEISNCPLFGCRIVHTVLSNPELTAMWKQDLHTMASRIRSVRGRLRQQIEQHKGAGDWAHLESQIGMFSYTGLTEQHVQRLRDVHHVYLMRNGRASLSGVNEDNVEYVAGAISEVIQALG